MPTRTKPAWYAHCWMFCLSQFGMPATGLGVKLGMLTAQLTERGARTGIYTQSRTSSLIGYSDDVVKRHYVKFRLFRVASDSGYVFYHNLDCVLLLFVFIRLDRKYYLFLYLNCFYKVLICSLPSRDMLLQTECKFQQPSTHWAH